MIVLGLVLVFLGGFALGFWAAYEIGYHVHIRLMNEYKREVLKKVKAVDEALDKAIKGRS